MSVMQIVTQTAAGPARLGAAAATVSLARTFGSAIGASAFGALIYGLIGGAPVLAASGDAAAAASVHRAFAVAFVAGGGALRRGGVRGEPRPGAALRSGGPAVRRAYGVTRARRGRLRRHNSRL
jgi:hypothetical protein